MLFFVPFRIKTLLSRQKVPYGILQALFVRLFLLDSKYSTYRKERYFTKTSQTFRTLFSAEG
ncbi:hypothetical protein CG478_015920 [Bacillus cytotoxicus]|nr:hypothetical protein CG483_015920 [Bacillus cytotoxicus]AWC41806.1 hypothetical protein CG480_015920 [Bacillus cytotoxicus]AWC45651.1 hypothetical protein CG479_014870 [Bacillus cytotoxicus]AWC49737.1 hypothetical protein CG478_015920 [Bacillus cytotoxicus]AWC53752.1 hypothetical protein CG477_015880 [Bacillus cytotoxicus]